MYADEQTIMDDWVRAINTQIENLKGNNTMSSTTNQNGERPRVGLDDFDMLTIIGQGSFGKVVQVRMKATGDIFAMKVLNKKNDR